MNRMTQSYSFSQLSILLHAPAKSGIYLLRTSARCIYVGETDNIRKNLLAHLRGDMPWITLWAPSRFSFELCDETSRVVQKIQLTARLQPVVGSHDRAVAAPAWNSAVS